MAVTETFYVVDFPYDDMLKYMIRKLDESGGDSAIDDKHTDYHLQIKKCNKTRLLNPVNPSDELISNLNVNCGYVLQVIPVTKAFDVLEDAITFYFDAFKRMSTRISFYKDKEKANIKFEYNELGKLAYYTYDKNASIVPSAIYMVSISSIKAPKIVE